MESESELSDFDDSELKDESADEAYLPAPSDQPKVEQKSKVNGLKHLISLKESLKLEEFQLKQSNKKARKKRQKERKRLKKLASKGLSGRYYINFTFVHFSITSN